MADRNKRILSCLIVLAGFLAFLLPVFCMQKETAVMEEGRKKLEEKEAGAPEDMKPVLQITNLSIDGTISPVGIDHNELSFSWELLRDEKSDAGVFRKAYQICIYEKEKGQNKEPVWDSGIVQDEKSSAVRYQIAELSDFTPYEWQVFVYDENGNCYRSERADFITGYVTDEPFAGAKMITMSEEENVYYEGMPVYLKDFDLSSFSGKKLANAYLCISALGQFEAYLNGEKAGDAYFAPGWSDYHKRLLYRVYDVTDQVKSGEENRIAVLVGTGWWAGRNAFGTYDFHRPALCAQLIFCFEDGTRHVIPTDESWRYRKDTAVRDADYFNGETFDPAKPDVRSLSLALKDPEESENSTESSTEKEVFISNDFDGIFSAYCGPEVTHVTERDQDPKTLTVYEGVSDNGTDFGQIRVISEQKKENEEPLPGNFSPLLLKKGQTLIADLGQNMTGVPEITVAGKDGGEVTILFSEMLNDSGEKARGNDGPMGSLYRESYRSAETTVRLLLNGGAADESTPVTYSPSLFYTGFRYLSVEATEDIQIYELKGLAVGNESRESGFIETDQPGINRLYENVKWSQFNNFFLVATDCPQRDERLGWMGDLGSFAKASMYNVDLRAFYEKWGDDLLDSQSAEGAFPDTVPRTAHTGEGNGGWADAGIRVPYEVYCRYGDKAYLEKLYPAMCRYMDYLYAKSNFDPEAGLIGPGNIYADWLGAQDTDSDFLCAMWYGADAKTICQVAQILGKKEDVKAYQKLSEQIMDFLESRYISQKKETGFTQTELLFLLSYELYETNKSLGEDPYALLSDMLAIDVEKNDCKVVTGFAGTPLLLPVLCQIGREDLAYRVLLGEQNPSWMYSLDQGATTIWERYDSYTKENGFQDAAMNSFDHFNEGSVAGWMYEYMAGITVDHTKEQPILICPYLPPQSLFEKDETGEKCPQKVSGCYHSVYGIIQVDWRLEGNGKAVFDLKIPDNAKAEVSLPVEGFETKILSGGEYHFEGIFMP